MNISLPGSSVRGSETGRPIMALLDLLGRRTALRVLWELYKSEHRFRPLQALAETNPSVLNARLGELQKAKLVETGSNGYRLSSRGQSLVEHLLPLHGWSDEWAEHLAKIAAAPLRTT